MAKRIVYADNAATTPLSKTALSAMMPYLSENYGNPSSVYAFASKARGAVEKAREKVALALNAEPNEIYFTGCGTEADNWAIKGALFKNIEKGGHIISSAFEHHAISHTLEYLEKKGFEITLLDVGESGIVSPESLEKALRPDTRIVSIMAANNEIGTIQPIKELAAIARAKNVLFHTDAVQTAGHIPIDVKDLGVDMLSISAHKFHGPKGVGALYIRRGLRIEPLLHGGGHERGLRSGTENVAGIVGMSAALEEAVLNMPKTMSRLTAIRDRLISGVLENIPYSRLTGDRNLRLPGTASFLFSAIEGESLVLKLSDLGIMASTGSACTSGSLEPSHVLLALGIPHAEAHGSLRLTLGSHASAEDVDYILEVLPGVIKNLRDMSPLWSGGKPVSF